MEPVYTPVVGLARAVFRGLGLRFDITGEELVPRTGGAVMAINHVGYLDFTFAGLAARKHKRLVRFMAKQEVFDHRVAGPLMRGMKHIPVDRVGAAAESYKLAVEALRRGEIVGVFPEATISQSFELKEFKTGAARMAMEAGVPLLPTVVWGSQRVFTKNRPRDLSRGTPIRIVVGEPFSPAPGSDALEVTAELKARMQALLVQARSTYPGSPRTPDDTWWIPSAEGGTAPTLEEASARDAEERAAKAARRAARDAERRRAG
ncbi:MAG TPA: lysophospholipid acyltransferase family protein [Mycobacteriales bacterium]|nr:lysophospholipid acyltransferase family protein [Mycobacteriales bacterium]